MTRLTLTALILTLAALGTVAAIDLNHRYALEDRV